MSTRLGERRLSTLAYAAVAAIAAWTWGASASAALPVVPTPTVTGPIASVAPGDPSRNYTFLATPIDLAARGYVEEEYFISGNACRYTGTGLANATPGSCSNPYRTRIVVRRPADAGAFNGTVIAEWQNVTAQYDVDHYWLESGEHIIRSGYAWVGVSAQRAGIQGALPLSINTLRNWSPLRYGTLDVTAGGSVTDDGLSYDIFSQAVQALRAPAGVAPMGPLAVERVIAAGTSQSGSRLALYHNSIWPLYRPVVDAFFIGESRGSLRTDLPVPVFRLLSEVDVAAAFAPPDAANYRHWEVAGSSHADFGFISNLQPLIAREQLFQQTPICTVNPLSRIPKRYAYHAAWDHMVAWVRDGILPPTAPRIAFVDTDPGAGVSLAIDRDAFGNARGGLRLSEHSVPTARNGAPNTGNSLFCGLFGLHLPFSDAQLAALYRTHGQYVSQVARANNSNVRAGFLLPVDSEESTEIAAESVFGKR